MISRSPLLAAALLLAGLAAGGGDHPAEKPSAAQSRDARQFVREMDAGMAKMHEEMHESYTGDPDVDFLALMIAHHDGAVEMARVALLHGRDPLTRRIAEEIIASQAAEGVSMRRRLAMLSGRPDPAPDGFPALHGTRGP
jgi:uncharacterized protein (DUF305 family)